MSKDKSIFKNKNFSLLFFGKLVSQVGDAIYNLSVAWFILSLTGSSVQMGVYIATCALIFLIFTPVGGVLADKFNRVKVLYMTDFIRGFVVLASAIVIYLDFSVSITLITLYLTGIILNVSGSIFAPASMAIVPELIEETDLLKANSFMSMIQQFSSILGVIAGGIIYGIIGPFGVFIINGISYLLSAITEVFIKPIAKKAARHDPQASFLKQLKLGLTYILKNKGLATIISFAVFLNFLFPPIVAVFLPYIFNQTLKVAVFNLSITEVALSFGGIVGAIALTKQKKEIEIRKAFIYGSLTLFPFISLIPLLLYFRTEGHLIHFAFMLLLSLILMVVGIIMSIINIPVYASLQKNINPDLLGRIFSIIMTLCSFAMPLGVLLFGWLIAQISVIPALIVNAAILALVLIVMIIKRQSLQVNFTES